MDFLRRKQTTDKTPNTNTKQKMNTPPNPISNSSSPSASTISANNTLSKISDVPIHCDPQTSILSASLLMKEKRTHCLLIIDETSGKLTGLTTTKDLAFRAVAKNLDLNTPISEIMSKNPYFVSRLTSPNDALKLMVNRRIRHLPIVNENELVIGILNITTCFYNAMIRLERMSEKSKELECTFNDLNDNDNSNLYNSTGGCKLSKSTSPKNKSVLPNIKIKDHTNLIKGNNANQLDLLALNEGLLDLNISRRRKKIIKDLKSLISMMKQPDLKSLLNDNELTASKPFYIDSKTSIWDASQLLLKHNLTAALIVHTIPTDKTTKDTDLVENIIGILTTKDLVYRVLACKIESKSAKVVRVMTPKPDFANDSMAIHNALRLMYEGKYLNLPIKNSSNEVTGLVNVLDLTYALLKLLNNSVLNDSTSDEFSDDNSNFKESGSFAYNDHSSNNEKSAPAWNKFWDTLDKPLNQVSSTTRRSYSSLLDKKFITRRSASFASVASEPTQTPSPTNTYVDVKLDESLKFTSSPSKELDIRSLNDSSTEKLCIKVKIQEQSEGNDYLNLGLHDKIYRFDHTMDNDENDSAQLGCLLDLINSTIKKKINMLKCSELSFNMGYLDDDQDFITIDSIDDFKLAISYNRKSYLHLILKITKNASSSILSSPNDDYSDLYQRKSDENHEKNSKNDTSIYIVLGGIGIFIFVISRLIFISKRS